jgi:esterase
MNKPSIKILLVLMLFLSLCGCANKDQPSIMQAAPLKRVDIGEVKLATRITQGKGVPILFIHGSWDDHHSWLPVAEELLKKRNNPIVLYDRRGHSASTDVIRQGHISDDVSDAALLIQKLGLGPVHVVGHSYGANIAISLANEHPELVSSLFLYEPPVFTLLKGKKGYAEITKEAKKSMLEAKSLLERGDIEKGTITFMEKVAFGKGSWENLFDERARACMIANADTWLDQSRDQERLSVNVDRLNDFKKPITLAHGDQSLPIFRAVITEMHNSVPAIRLVQCSGAGHGGPISHPEQIARMINNHIRLGDPATTGGNP